MQNGAREEPVAQPAPSISADFLTGSTEIGLDRIRARLLDLTKPKQTSQFQAFQCVITARGGCRYQPRFHPAP